MESLQIHNFLNIKKAELEIKRINIVIGEQSTGKSVIAKIFYLFKNFLSSTFRQALLSNKNQRELKKEFLNNFTNSFPKYTWGDQEFIITYTLNNIILTIQRKKNKAGSFRLNFTYSDYFKKIFISISKKVKKINKPLETIDSQKNLVSEIEEKRGLLESISEYISKSDHNNLLKNSVFIPANRSFFANLQENVFFF